MDGLMKGGEVSDAPRQILAEASARLAALLEDANGALRGETIFGVQQVRGLSALLAEVAPVWARAPELRRTHPELTAELDLYKSLLEKLAITLRRVRLMLLAQRSQLEARRAQFSAVRQWAATAQQTCGPEM